MKRMRVRRLADGAAPTVHLNLPWQDVSGRAGSELYCRLRIGGCHVSLRAYEVRYQFRWGRNGRYFFTNVEMADPACEDLLDETRTRCDEHVPHFMHLNGKDYLLSLTPEFGNVRSH